MPPIRTTLTWRHATVVAIITETESAHSVVFDVPEWDTHRAGQHVDVRLTAPDGYQATRSYSLSSAPGEAPQITVERVDDGEVSPYLVDVVEVGDRIELRGPIGGYFVAEPDDEPLLLVGGGSGIAPLRAMWRARTPTTPTRILYSARTPERIIFGDELARLDDVDVQLNLTRVAAGTALPPGHVAGRISPRQLADAALTGPVPHVFLCGPTMFVEAASSVLAETGLDPKRIRTERFG